jgi:hypothetical protein
MMEHVERSGKLYLRVDNSSRRLALFVIIECNPGLKFNMSACLQITSIIAQIVGKRNRNEALWLKMKNVLQQECKQIFIPDYPFLVTCIEHIDLLKRYFDSMMDMLYISKQVGLDMKH